MVEIEVEERSPEFPSDFWGEVVNVSMYTGKFAGNETVDVAIRADKPKYKNLQHIFLPKQGVEFEESSDGRVRIRLNKLTYAGLFYSKLMELGWKPRGEPKDHLELAQELIGLKAHFKRVDLKEIDPRMRTRTEKWMVVELGAGEPR